MIFFSNIVKEKSMRRVVLLFVIITKENFVYLRYIIDYAMQENR